MCGVVKSPDFPDDNDDDKLAKAEAKECKCTRVKRFTRILLKLMAAALTIYVCVLSSERYFMYWVQTTIERTDIHVSEIPFPAITICPTHLSIANLTGAGKDPKEVSRLNRLYNLVQSTLWTNSVDEEAAEVDFKEFEEYDNISLYNFDIRNYDYKCEELFMQCTWRRRPIDCCSIFRDFGVGFSCYAFNYIHSGKPDPTWPWSVASAGAKSGLNIKLNRFFGDYKLERVGVVIQEPEQYLGTSLTHSPDDRIVVPLTPLRFTAETGVKARPVEMRHCYFSDEVSLSRSRSSCIHSCQVHYITKKCECQYELPMAIKEPLDNGTSTRKCSIKDLACLKKHKVSLFFMSNIIEESTDYVFNTTDCKCYPNCNHIQYHAATYTDNLGGSVNGDYVEVDIYFQEETLFSYRSTLHITMVDLMVSYGGIAGLFLGVSLVGGINALLDRIGCCKPSGKPV